MIAFSTEIIGIWCAYYNKIYIISIFFFEEIANIWFLWCHSDKNVVRDEKSKVTRISNYDFSTNRQKLI